MRVQENAPGGARRRARLAAAVMAVAVALPLSGAPNPLRFFKNYFVTGDYSTAGVTLRGRASGGFANGSIAVNSVPDGADVIAAFLYWQTFEIGSSTFGAQISFKGKAVNGRLLGSSTNPACAISPDTSVGFASARVYRADVLRHLAIDKTRNIRIANGAHDIRVPDNGANVLANGASLVLVYRIVTPGNPAVAPLRAVVIYDGSSTIHDRSTDDKILWLPTGGFYQATQSPAAKVTAIGGLGQAGPTAVLEVNDAQIAARAFNGLDGSRWFNPTYPFTLNNNASQYTLAAEAHGGSGDRGCAMFAATVTSLNVTDSDRDGLLDVWESGGLYYNAGSDTAPAAFGTCAAFPGQPCVNLPAMGAINGQKDIFIEMDWLEGQNDGKPGTHQHKPKVEALVQVANAFRRQNIRLHFDTGGNYQNLAVGPDFMIVPQAHARGGEVIQESTLLCPNALTPMASCTYTSQYSVLSYKKGLVNVRDGNPRLGLPSRFSRDRKDIFHYALWGHALAGPFDPATGRPLSTEPKSISGVADRPGGDLLITLGMWRSNLPENDQIGSVLVQAGTLMHELGHNLGLSHAGAFRVPNCMPNYQSVMNYLYQTRGMTPAAGGDKVIDFSPGILASLNEQSLLEPGANAPYRIRYYGPVTSSDPPGSAAQLRCDGSPIAGERLIRLENDFTNFVDWDHDGKTTQGPLRIDVNFSGALGDGVNGGAVFLDANDWSLLNLQQISARLNVGGLSTGIGALELGVSDLGALELGALELGVSDLGALELGALELGDVDYETSVLSTIDPPPGPSPSCPACGLQAASLVDRIRLTWSAPETGNVLSYNIYRNSPANPTVFTLLRSVPGGQATLTADDAVNGSTTLFNTAYSYYVTSFVQAGGNTVESLPSNQASGMVKRIFIAGLNPVRLYLDPNPAVLFSASGLDLPAPAGAVCTTAATAASNAGKYPVVCAGPATTSNPVNGISYTNGTLTINPRPQSINFAAITEKSTADSPLALTATATSGLAIVYTAAGVCTVSGSSATLTGAGNCTIKANQPGNGNWLPAAEVQRTFTVTQAGFSFANFAKTTGLTFNANVSVTPAGALRVTENTAQRSSTWFTQPQPVTRSFTSTFKFQVTPGGYSQADGFAFVIQTGSANAIGAAGGGMGYHGLPGSLAIEFDTYGNTYEFNETAPNHIAIQSNGVNANTARHGAPATLAINYNLPFRIADRAIHTAVVTYAPGSLKVAVDGVTVATAAVNLATLLGLPANGTARIGFTGGTGTVTQITDILSWTFAPGN